MRLLTGAIRLDDDDDLIPYTTTDDKQSSVPVPTCKNYKTFAGNSINKK